MNGERAPDKLEKGVRLGCGLLAGVVFGTAAARVAYTLGGSLLAGALLAIGVALLFGILALRSGDRFWNGLRHWLWFWP